MSRSLALRIALPFAAFAPIAAVLFARHPIVSATRPAGETAAADAPVATVLRPLERLRLAHGADAAVAARDGSQPAVVSLLAIDGDKLVAAWPRLREQWTTCNLLTIDGELCLGTDRIAPDQAVRVLVPGAADAARAILPAALVVATSSVDPAAVGARNLDLQRLMARQAATFPPPPPAVARDLGPATAVRPNVRLRTFWFPSPQPSGNERNDRVACRLFTPLQAPIGAIVVLPIWIEPRGPALEEAQCLLLASHGFAALLVPLAWQHARTRPGETSGRRTLSADVDQTLAAWRQSVADVRAAARLLAQMTDLPLDRVALLGTSLGGYVAGVAYGVDPQLRHCAMLLAGGGMAEMLANPPREAARLGAALRAAGQTVDTLRDRVAPIDPLTYADPARRDGLFLAAGLRDPVAPPARVSALWRAYGEPRIEWLPADHYSGIVYLPAILERFADFLRVRFGERPR